MIGMSQNNMSRFTKRIAANDETSGFFRLAQKALMFSDATRLPLGAEAEDGRTRLLDVFTNHCWFYGPR